MGFSDCHPQNALHVPKNERILSEDKRIADVFSSDPICQLVFFFYLMFYHHLLAELRNTALRHPGSSRALSTELVEKQG